MPWLFLFSGGRKEMRAASVIHHRPCPRIQIVNPETGAVKLSFYLDTIRSLQSFNFSLSNGDLDGSFSLTFFPDRFGKDSALFDVIAKLDVVMIYEGYTVINFPDEKTRINAASNQYAAYPVFTGIIHTKKYVTQMGDSGATRRMSITGTAITGLVSQFAISLDVTACSLTKQFQSQEEMRNKLTISNLEESYVKEVIKNAWEAFVDVSNQLGTAKMVEYIERFMGAPDEFFDIEEIQIGYKLGCLFRGETTHDFFSIADHVLPSPYYEKTAYTNRNGKMKIRIRQSPFDADKWSKNQKIKLDGRHVKSFELTESDSEVYTVFFAYLDGSSLEEEKMRVIASQNENTNSLIQYDAEKFKVYGYRPLFASFRGYTPPDSDSDSKKTGKEAMREATENLRNWYGNLENMLSGSITLAMTYRNETNFIMPGDVVEFLGGEFYVDGVSHSWTYNGGGEINLSVSRGGKYENGSWARLSGVTDKIKMIENRE